MPDYRDIQQSSRAVACRGPNDGNLPLVTNAGGKIQKDMVFADMDSMKLWLAEYVVVHHRPFEVAKSNENLRYVVKCKRGCPWSVHCRKRSDNKWRISSVV